MTTRKETLEALAPFASMLKSVPKNAPDTQMFWSGKKGDHQTISAGAIRLAAKVHADLKAEEASAKTKPSKDN